MAGRPTRPMSRSGSGRGKRRASQPDTGRCRAAKTSAARPAGRAIIAARLAPGQSVELPEAPYLHVFVASGSVELEGAGPLLEGDAVRLTGVGGHRVTASSNAEILVWEMHAALSFNGA